jgi:hypothetical protein
MNVQRGVHFFISVAFFVSAIVLLSVASPRAYADDAASSTTPTTEETATQTTTATSTDDTGGAASDTGGTIATGDATASTTVDNSVNQNNIDPDHPGEEMNSSTLTSTSTSDAIVSSEASSTAATGENSIDGGTGINTIVTGNAQSTANVINEVNTNIFNSDGLILFLNQILGGGVDLTDYDLSYFFVGGPGASPDTDPSGHPQCTLLTCLNSSSLNVFNMNTAVVTNSVIVRASTGGNSASSTSDANIDTGDAYAAANVVNLVNTNIVNSSYLLVAFNNFGDLVENVTLPGADFFDRLFASGFASSTMNSSTYDVVNENDATLTGTTTATADTGNNIASTTDAIATSTSATSTPDAAGSAQVETGNAVSSSHAFNQVNTTGVGGTAVFLMFRVAGNWTGHVVGLPDGLVEQDMEEGGDRIISFVSRGATSTPAGQLLQEYNSSHFLAAATSSASVENDIDVAASTGGNSATTENGTSTIHTGNAYSSASVVNLINTNIVGQNWIFGVFNVLGNMSGNIVFGGSPILAVDGSVSPTAVSPGDTVTYTFTVTNAGNGNARNVILQSSFDNTLLSFDTGSVSGGDTTTGRSWNLGSIPQGESKTFSFTAHVGTNFPAGATANVPLSIAAVNTAITSPITSNTAEVDLTVSSPGGGGRGSGGGSSSSSQSSQSSSSNSTRNSSVTVTKTATASSTPGYVDYKVDVYNQRKAGPLYNAVLTDTLYDPSGATMYNRSWQLATLAPGDDIILTYTVAFAASSTPGTYHNVAKVTGNDNKVNGAALSAQGSADIAIGGQVLGAATSTVPVAASSMLCPFVSHFMQTGMTGGEVLRLQVFLNALQGAGLPTTGFFGPMTRAAVNRFQQTYASDILTPLGLATPTGSVYTRTLNKINSLMCGEASSATSTISH